MIIFDAHSCLPLRPDTDINQLRRHFDAGVRYVSVNIGMDFNPLNQIFSTIAGFIAQIEKSAFCLLAETKHDIEKALRENKLAISFDLEGGIPLLEMPEMVNIYKRLGVRQIHLAYNRNNSLSGGAHDIPQGLTKLGEKIVDEIHRQKILMDISHSDEKTALDICSYSENRPVIYSHANPNAVFMHGRNASDKALRAVAKTGGLVCLNGVGSFLGDPDLKPSSLVQMIDYTVEFLGIDKVGIGLDYAYDDGISDMPDNLDRSYWWPQSAGYGINGLSGRYMPPEALLEVLTILRNKGYREDDLEALFYRNLHNLIKKVWD